MERPKRKHPLTMRRVMDAVERSMSDMESIGFCLDCGAEAEGVEPDAEGYKCEECGAMKVAGAEEILLRLV